jgi:hypothetical protein
MNKRANRRAFFICAVICLMYISVIIKVPEKLRFQRVSDGQKGAPQSMSISIPKPAPEEYKDATSGVAAPVTSTAVPHEQKEPVVTPPAKPPEATAPVSHDNNVIEPSILISLPLISFAIKERLVERDGLIFVRKDGYNEGSWKKPLDILKDKDVEGLKNISRNIGKKHSLEFLKKEGIKTGKDLTVEDIILGKGYTVEKEKIIALYNTFASEDYAGLFPFAYKGVGVFKGKNGFEIVKTKDDVKVLRAKEEPEWMMPNLVNLSMKDAIEKLTLHTTKVKVYGSGYVTEQWPKAFERMKTEAECSIQGRTHRQ